MTLHEMKLRMARLEQEAECARKLAAEYLSDLNAETVKRIELEREVQENARKYIPPGWGYAYP